MTKQTGLFKVEGVSLTDVLNDEKKSLVIENKETKLMKIETALETIIKQMQVSGYRERTMSDYRLHMNHFCQVTGAEYLSQINLDSIYQWLDSMSVSNATKSIRLKCLKAILGRCFDNGWIKQKFWKPISIKVDKNVKKGSTSEDINILLSLLDLNTFIGLRDAVAILTLYKTGIRITTLAKLEERHIDFDNLVLNLDGAILKNHSYLKMPIDTKLASLLKVMIEQNNKIKLFYGEKNNYIFITQKGKSLLSKSTNNAISKQLHKYSKRYDLLNINPHAIRRGFAKNLYNKGANIALISKSLSHSNLAVTTQYLDLDVDEVATSLRDFL